MKINSKILCLVLAMVVALGMFTGVPTFADDQIIEEVEEIVEETEDAEEGAEGTEDVEDTENTEEDEEVEDTEEDTENTDGAENDDEGIDDTEDNEDKDTEEDTENNEEDTEDTEKDEDENQPVFSDMPDNWSTAALEHAVANGLLQGNNGRIMPDYNLTRAEMATIVVRAFGAEIMGDLGKYTDIDMNEWYVDDISRAYQMGVIKGTADKMNPNNDITREEAFAIIARAFKLQPSDTINEEFSDVEDITEWATGEVYTLVNNGYIHGSNGELRPTAKITRAEFAQMLYNIAKQYVQAEGIVTEAQDGNVIVNAANVTMKDMTINGDLIIGDGVGDGEVILDNVQVTERMVVRGGGTDSIIIKGSSNVANVIVARISGELSVKVQDEANVELVYVDEESDDVNIEGIVDSVQINADDIAVTVISAQINSISHSGKNATVIIDENSEVETMHITAENAKVEVAGKVTSITTEAVNTQISGNGQVVNVDVQVGADNTSIGTPNTEITVDEGVSGVTGAGQQEIAGGTTVRNNAEGTGIITPEPTPPVDDEDNDETDPVETTLSMSAGVVTIETGEQFTMPINVKGTVADDDEDNMVRLYAVISGLTADDIELEAIEGGTPAIVTDEAELGYVGAQEGDLVLAWGPTEGFPLLASDYADNGLTSSFVATINKVGNYTVKFVFYDLDGQKQLNDENDSVSITVTEVTEG